MQSTSSGSPRALALVPIFWYSNANPVFYASDMHDEAPMKTAIVLSGGGIRGPLEVGALESLLEHGIVPDMLIGTSAGAINAAFLAAAGADVAAIPTLKAGWRKGSQGAVYPGNVLTIAWRVITNADGAFPSDGMRRLIRDNLPPGVATFGQLKLPCYLTAVDLQSGRLYLFGDDPAAPLVDAVMASSSIPVYQPPVDYQGLQLVDGGVVEALPLSVALDKGGTRIYAVNVGRGEEVLPAVHGIFNIFMRTIDTFIVQNTLEDLARASADPAVELHHIHITAFHELAFNDFSHTEEMFVVGKQITDAYLANPQPLAAGQPTAVSRAAPEAAPGGAARPLHAVSGAHEIVPLRARGRLR